MMGFAGQKVTVVLWEEVDRTRCGLFCSVELIVLEQKRREMFQTPSLSHHVTETFTGR